MTIRCCWPKRESGFLFPGNSSIKSLYGAD